MRNEIQTESLKWNMSDHAALIAFGHSPAKAHEIVMDKKRGDKIAKEWILFVHSNGHQQSPHDKEQPDIFFESIKHEETEE